MSIVSKICISSKSGENMKDVDEIEVVANKGIINDRYVSEKNELDTQITLIESENIDYYNEISKTNVPYINFRRNIITKGVQLNELINKDFFVGKIKLRAHRLCEPCKYLQDKINDKKLVKKLVNRGGLRCQILTNGKISVKDLIKIQ